jgi:hypothetical protein
MAATAPTAARPDGALLPEGRFDVDASRSSTSFAVAHFRLQTVRGSLSGLTGCVAVADGRLVAHGGVDAASISTGNSVRDAHLRSYLLAAKHHPRLELRVDAPLAPVVPVTVWVRGRPVTAAATLCGTPDDLAVRLELDRRAAGLTWPAPVELGGVAVGRTVTIDLRLALRPA